MVGEGECSFETKTPNFKAVLAIMSFKKITKKVFNECKNLFIQCVYV